MKPRPKGRKDRLVAISPEISQLVLALIAERSLGPEDRLFSMPDGTAPKRSEAWPTGVPIGRSYFREYVWKPAHDRSGLELRRFHDLRGSHITWLLSGNADIVTVMKRVGHNRMSTTQLYLTALADADERALDALAKIRAKYRVQPPTE
ncbi:MAG: tyrosine-type recombinase/integrase [Nocardioides sp.]